MKLVRLIPKRVKATILKDFVDNACVNLAQDSISRSLWTGEAVDFISKYFQQYMRNYLKEYLNEIPSSIK